MGIRQQLLARLPWSVWGPLYRLVTSRPGQRSRFRRQRVGKHSYVDPSVQVAGWRNVRVGSNSTLSAQCWLNVNFRDESTERIVIGDFCHIGRRNFFSCGPRILIGDYCFTGIDCLFLGSGHDISSPLTPYIASGLSAGAEIELGMNCWLTTSVTVMHGVRIGRGSVIGARSVVTCDIPPFSVAAGNPCKVIKRFDFVRQSWIPIEQWSADLEYHFPTEAEHRAQLAARGTGLSPSLLSASPRFGWI
ncbi:hypothetical protein [Rhizobacter sp. SG703]|uniref:acyltransferase n=1 Tax=Rhizobacter sp. SG703 TaxID=2587140 RepID=UPI001447E200|nr:hypothetical protein [Rhizobacter sp. SG703]NKI95068.1 acetyltransferase-like isoleucine patch superfamily enzyme [Rhizobacter sp. SG703]